MESIYGASFWTVTTYSYTTEQRSNVIVFVKHSLTSRINVRCTCTHIVVSHVQNALYFWQKVRALSRNLLCERTLRFSRF